MLRASHWKIICLSLVFCGLIALAGLITLIVIWFTKLTPFKDYAVVVDAGSTHSKIFLYTWPADKSDGLGSTSRITQVKACDVPGGAITSIKDPTVEGVRQYFDSAMSICSNEIPSNRKSRTYIFLGGTAGLRLFEKKDPTYTNQLLNGTRNYFSTLGLHFKSPEYQVRIISGSEEGLSGWVSVNMLMGELLNDNQPSKTYGISDMGGASTQLSFIAPNATNDNFSMNLFNTDYRVYSHSYLCYGTEELRLGYLRQLVEDNNGSSIIHEPCLQQGYAQNLTHSNLFDTACAKNASISFLNPDDSSMLSFVGTGNYSQCYENLKKRFDKSTCTWPTCSFNNVYQPKPISPELKFVAISAWYPTFKGIAPNVSLSPDQDGNYNFKSVNFTKIKTVLAAVCNQPWSEIINNTDKYRPFLCFNSAYQWTLLEYGYSMTDENLKNFQIVKNINSSDIGWTLGYMINQTNSIPADFRTQRSLTESEFGGLVFLCSFVLVTNVIGFLIAWKCYAKRRDY